MRVIGERFLQDYKPRLNQIQVCSELICSRKATSVLINLYLLSIYTHNLIPAIKNIGNNMKCYLKGKEFYYRQLKEVPLARKPSYLLFLDVPDLVFEADEPVVDVGLIRLGRRGRRAQRGLQGAGGSRALPSRGHLLLGRLHPLLLPFLRPA